MIRTTSLGFVSMAVVLLATVYAVPLLSLDRGWSLVVMLAGGVASSAVGIYFSAADSRDARTCVRQHRNETTRGVRMSLINILLPRAEKWRTEAMMEERNSLRLQRKRLPWGHHLRLFRSACRILWDAKVQPRRQVD
ncbi:hypothetical protein ACWD5F_09785 [Streptomyces sp. NPDC002499]